MKLNLMVMGAGNFFDEENCVVADTPVLKTSDFSVTESDGDKIRFDENTLSFYLFETED